jgi:hypothetical protein
MGEGRGDHQSHLFTLRLWPEALGDGRVEWRGKVQHVLSGEAHYFRDWGALVGHLLAALPDVRVDGSGEREEEERA